MIPSKCPRKTPFKTQWRGGGFEVRAHWRGRGGQRVQALHAHGGGQRALHLRRSRHLKFWERGVGGKGDNYPKPTVPREEGFLENIKITIFIGITKEKL